MNQEPILKYTSLTFYQRKTITLWDDKVDVEGVLFLKGKYELTIPLEDISPYYSSRHERIEMFWKSYLVVVLLGIFLSCGATKPLLDVFIIGSLFVAILFCLATFRKI